MKIVTQIFAFVLAASICPLLYGDHHNKPVDLIGVWHAEASTDEGSRKITWTFEKTDGKITGTSVDQDSGDERNLDRVKIKEKQVVLEIDIEQDGNKGVIRVETEEKSPGKLTGKWNIVGDDGTEYMNGEITAVKQVAFAGTWAATSTLPEGGTLETEMKLKGRNGALKGLFDGNTGETEIDKVSVKENELHLKFDFEMNGNTINVEIKAKPKGNDKLVGKWMVVGEDGDSTADGDWTAERKPQGFAGKWNVVAVVPDNADYNGTLTLTEKDGKYAGMTKGSDNEASELETVKVDGKNLEFTVPFEMDGNSGTITVKAKQLDDVGLKGEWVLTSKDGDEVARDEWKATRE